MRRDTEDDDVSNRDSCKVRRVSVACRVIVCGLYWFCLFESLKNMCNDDDYWMKTRIIIKTVNFFILTMIYTRMDLKLIRC